MSARTEGRHGPGLARRGLYWTCWGFGRLLFAVWFRMRVRGRPRPFPTGPMIVAANHCSYLDPVLLGLSVRRRVVFLVTAAVYDVPWIRPLLWGLGCIPVESGANIAAMRAAIAELRRGNVVGIFPEGGISRDGRLGQGQAGVGALLVKAKAPIYPVGLRGTFHALPHHRSVPRPVPLVAEWGRPLDPGALDSRLSSAEARERVTRTVMQEVARLLPPDQAPVAVPEPVGDPQ